LSSLALLDQQLSVIERFSKGFFQKDFAFEVQQNSSLNIKGFQEKMNQKLLSYLEKNNFSTVFVANIVFREVHFLSSFLFFAFLKILPSFIRKNNLLFEP